MRKHLCLILFSFLAAVAAQAQDWKVIFSANGGFYEDVFDLELFGTHPQGRIFYTTNGNRPTVASTPYTEPIALDERMYSNSDIYTIINCPETDYYLPDSVRHCIVIRAALFDENDSCISPVATQSYFIQALGCDTHGLPAVSLCADSLDLFDYERGILVPGIYYDPLNPYHTGNYFQRGREWERLSNIEFYELDNSGINQQVGLRTHGKQSRWRSQKGMSVYARDDYGKKRLKHPFFEDYPLENFKHLCLKPYMSSWNGSGCKDYICGRMAQHINVESLASRPTALFLNGEYWGIYYVTEKPDKRFLEDHLGIDIENVTIIDKWYDLECGNSDSFYALRTWLETSDLSYEEQYAYAEANIDIPNFIDYYVLELFAANVDWPAYNMRMWQLGDGKWRWIFYDGDACLEDQTFDIFANATYDGDQGYPSNRTATLFFRRLLENTQFRIRFASRFNELVSGALSYENTKPYFDYIKQKLQDEVPNQMERFGRPPKNMEEWELYCMGVINQFLRERPEKILEELESILSYEKPLLVDVKCFPNPSSGEMHLSVEADAFYISQINIYDLLGRKVYAQPCVLNEGQTILTINPDLPAGVYVLKIGSSAMRIIVQ